MGAHFSIDGSSSIHGWYSMHVNGGFCLPCTLFAQSGYHGSDPGILVCCPMTFTKALELLRKHAEKGYHKETVVRADDLVKVMTQTAGYSK